MMQPFSVLFYILCFYLDITEEGFKTFVIDLLKRVHIEALLHGNLTKEVFFSVWILRRVPDCVRVHGGSEV